MMILLVGSAHAGAAGALPVVPADLSTYRDGRAAVQDIYSAYGKLVEAGWLVDEIAVSNPVGTEAPLPIIALRTPQVGPAAWFITGIHGEEPAGPNAMSRVVDALTELGEHHPVVLIPLANPHGYARNWRYLNVAVYSETVEGWSVGDSSHMLLDPGGEAPRAAAASSPEAGALTRYVVETALAYPPRYSIDLHEDNLIDEGYVYSQGKLGAADPLATAAVEILRDHEIAIKMEGQTRFAEDIKAGIIGPVIDSSIDELMSAGQIWSGESPAPGPDAHTVLVFETPAGALGIEQRIRAHATLLRLIAKRIATDQP